MAPTRQHAQGRCHPRFGSADAQEVGRIAVGQAVGLGDGFVDEVPLQRGQAQQQRRVGLRRSDDALAGDLDQVRQSSPTSAPAWRCGRPRRGYAEAADFFSFGTNDLTQTTWGFSRDDVEAAVFAAYLEKGVFTVSPFETIDADGIGRLAQIGADEGRATKPGLKLGVCGEHGGDPESVHFFHEVGLDYVSCSPFRVPIARLEAGRAAAGDDPETTT